MFLIGTAFPRVGALFRPAQFFYSFRMVIRRLRRPSDPILLNDLVAGRVSFAFMIRVPYQALWATRDRVRNAPLFVDRDLVFIVVPSRWQHVCFVNLCSDKIYRVFILNFPRVLSRATLPFFMRRVAQWATSAAGTRVANRRVDSEDAGVNADG